MREPISKKERFEVFKRDKFTCQYCGQKSPDVTLQLDHIRPVSKGGKNLHDNLRAACSACNAGKRDSLLDELVVESEEKCMSCDRLASSEDLNKLTEGLAFLTIGENFEFFPICTICLKSHLYSVITQKGYQQGWEAKTGGLGSNG